MPVPNFDTSGPFAVEDIVIALNPFAVPSARVTAAAVRAGGLGVLDLTAGGRRAAAELALAEEWSAAGFGVRLRDNDAFPARDLPTCVHTVLLTTDASCTPDDFPTHRVLVEVTDRAQALRAAAAGAHGLVARGHEAGGPVGELSTFVLLQQLLAEDELDLPVWACGGAGPHTAAAVVAGGGAGVVLDTQLALLAEAEAELPAGTAALLAGLDGSETTVEDGRRVLRRRGAPEGTPAPEIGQDGFLAARFQERWGTVHAAVRGVRDAVLDSLKSAGPGLDSSKSAGPGLGHDGTGTRPFGSELPVAQGPMTRVSDQAAFAAEVGGHGGLPFIALALSGADQTRAVLERTRDALGDAPWGVGVLGFAAEEIKAAQLEVVREIRPSHAIIAGGRPAQAAALEEVGISTFLHVPSPGLLKQFLEAGARKFVFEGAECGGHVGPRGSFPLWEAQLGVLDDFLAGAKNGTAGELRLFFAGGVHDERSAAMVTALTAPLSARGAAVGVLMGTAYLFTEEAVSAGAVLPLFQRQVIDAERTDLLETAPGHATRCVHSPFTDEFAAVKEDLAARGTPGREAWEQLEQLNVGRLRLASKGIERVDGALSAVGEDRQLAEGMFMAGEVAVLRSAVTTVAALHASVTTGAAGFLAARREALGIGEGAAEPSPEPLDIAIVGMACMFPGAPDLATFWANVLAGEDAVTEVPATRWDAELYHDLEGAGEKTPSRWGGFLPEIPFEPLRYGIPPASLPAIEPVQLLALEAARRALEDSGYGSRSFDRSRASVVFGAEAGSDLSNAMTLRSVLPAYLGSLPPALDEQLPHLTEDSFPGVLANVIAGRIANRLDLGGANYTVDAACASSLTAVDVACKELVSGTSDLVLCGGADLHNGINDYLLFASAHALSPSGRSAPFDSAADGIALGEGVGCVVLKRLADAERDGDRVYAVIKGVGSASDGRALGLTAPRPEGQYNALTRAYRNAGVSPAEVGLVEAHGTGTVVGDRTELGSLTRVFEEAGAPPGACALGSVKSQIGHTKCAAGLAGLIKTSLALHTGVRPPTLHLTEPNPAWDAQSSPFAFHTEARPWSAAPAERVAGVSAFGFGGTNFHVVLRAYEDGPPPVTSAQQWPAELFTFRGADRAAAVRTATELLALVEAESGPYEPWRLRDFALAASRRSEAAATRGARSARTWVALVAGSTEELTALLRRAVAGEHAPKEGLFTADESETGDSDPGDIALLFPGQGSQRPGMFAELFVAFPELQRHLRLDETTARVLYPPTAFDEAGRKEQQERITDTTVAQPALGLTGLAAFQLLTRAGVRPAMAAGHSYGELAALAAAGALTPDALLRTSRERAAAILRATGEGDPGTMAAVSAGEPEVAAALTAAGLAGSVVTANRNSPRQTVISGPTEDVLTAVERLRAQGLGAQRIPVACAFHSPLVAAACETFAQVLAGVPFTSTDFPVWSNRTAARYPRDPEAVRAELAAQIGSPVRFADQIEAMYEAGARVFVEAGPGSVLTRLVGTVLGDRPHRTVALEDGRRAGRTGLVGFLAALAQLAVAGVDIRTSWLFQGRDAVPADARAPRPRRAAWTVDGHLIRTADGAIPATALHPAERVPEALVTHSSPVGPAAVSGSEALISEFLRTSREMIAAQRDVMLGYLGADPGVRPTAPAPVTYTDAPVTVTALPAAAPVAVAVPAGGSVLSVVLEVIGERTGYPVDMIEPDLDLEADLSVDSIKRAEIAGELATRLGLTTTGDTDVEELAKARTAAAITALVERASGAETTPTPAGAGAGASVSAVPTAESVLALVLDVIGERTGYPVDMIEPDLDLEADLSVDSIKRAEIAGELATRLGLTATGDTDVEELAKARTAASIAALVAGARGEVAEPERPEAGPAGPEPVVVAPRRLVMREFDLAPADPAPTSDLLIGRSFLLLGSGPVAEALTAHLTVHGAHALTAEEPPADGEFDGIVHLVAPDAPPVLPDVFPAYQRVLAGNPRWVLAAGASAGLRGFFRSLAREYPDTVARVVEHAPGTAPEDIAAELVAELTAPDREPVVLRSPGTRRGLRMAEEGLGLLGSTGAGPAGDGAAEAAALGLDSDSVVLLVGGARGITARFAATLAAASRCRIELFGRTALSGDGNGNGEDPALAAAGTAGELRTALIAGGLRVPAEIERAIGRIQAEREVRATLRGLAALGSEVRYRTVDALDGDTVRRAVKEIHAEHGRLDGVVYAAGVIEDKLIAEKSPRSYDRVFRTKVDGARELLDALGELPDGEGPRFAVLFGSVAAALGNRGQSDYAAANDALETLGSRWADSGTGRRGLTVHWGPWAPTGDGNHGMVTPELMRHYAGRGIQLIDPDEGTMSLLRELAWGPEGDTAVVYTASGW
ncbi:SDR family NAD(P)-dependent oxidoreductase [Streptomyces sp. NBC_00365]|uniref:type I polyketide synthase n=1 Tax=Streptomyces sp. NBC_00365 TaxID=2975726 RepID=UPI002255225C|nr:type I polyketide synthase [Streptomyces sp. NBC_00365]MCX5093770.1 SDR family NAD(P)-dependent oxidoreductase [Streptomyces sp. NBC_00365]